MRLWGAVGTARSVRRTHGLDRSVHGRNRDPARKRKHAERTQKKALGSSVRLSHPRRSWNNTRFLIDGRFERFDWSPIRLTSLEWAAAPGESVVTSWILPCGPQPTLSPL